MLSKDDPELVSKNWMAYFPEPGSYEVWCVCVCACACMRGGRGWGIYIMHSVVIHDAVYRPLTVYELFCYHRNIYITDVGLHVL